MNQVNSKKLLHSKWTAVVPARNEKHFIVTAVEADPDGHPVTCVVEAVHSGAERTLPWRDLKDTTVWRVGWI